VLILIVSVQNDILPSSPRPMPLRQQPCQSFESPANPLRLLSLGHET
jgi:hypothetical protein